MAMQTNSSQCRLKQWREKCSRVSTIVNIRHVRAHTGTHTRTHLNGFKYVRTSQRTYVPMYVRTRVRPFMCMYVHVYVRTRVRTRTVYIFTHVRTYANRFYILYVRKYIRTQVWTYVMYLYIDTCVHTFTRTYTSMHMYFHTYARLCHCTAFTDILQSDDLYKETSTGVPL